jgi:hypothetical protein
MCKIWHNERGAKVIQMTSLEATSIGFGLGVHTGCVCARCGEIIKDDDIYYIADLHDVMDHECLVNWLEHYIFYPEDRKVVDRNYMDIVSRLSNFYRNKTAFEGIMNCLRLIHINYPWLSFITCFKDLNPITSLNDNSVTTFNNMYEHLIKFNFLQIQADDKTQTRITKSNINNIKKSLEEWTIQSFLAKMD